MTSCYHEVMPRIPGHIYKVSQRKCAVEDCEHLTPRYGGQFCSKHYREKWIQAGRSIAPEELERRFWSKVKKTDTCWLWTGTKHFMKYMGHYGEFWAGYDRRSVHAHRFAYELLVGQIPEGLQIDHLCRNTLCVNPEHLEAVTSRVNSIERGQGPNAQYARRTHCKNGHPFDEVNTWIRPDGTRICRICKRQA